MNKKIMLIGLYILLNTSYLVAAIQPNPIGDPINQKDSSNRKQGFWSYTEQRQHYEVYYKNDTLNGSYKAYYQNKVLAGIGTYYKGREIGIWYSFNEIGRLYLEVSKIKYTTRKINQKEAYVKTYYDNGNCKEEGYAKYDDIEIDYEKIGVWKKYNKNGGIFDTTED